MKLEISEHNTYIRCINANVEVLVSEIDFKTFIINLN